MPRPQLFPARLCLLAMFAALVCADAALARIAAKDEPVTLQQAWNPKPDALDIELPMPCGLKMAFRAVAVPGEPGQEFPFMMGLANADKERRIYGERREGRIAGVFTANDLPIAWRALLEKSEWRDHTVYLIGKYEVSQAQWDAVMNGTCPAPEPPKPGMWDRLRGKKPDAPAAGASLPASAALPVREISWTDMQSFLGKYNEWLQKQPHALPRFVDNQKKTGFVRLPTEAEWEFAARGGMAVSLTTRENDAPFAVGKAEEYAVFAGKSRPTEPEPIGSRLPNALGLYDTAGNVKELLDEAFQRGGSAGGVLAKGGGFRNGENEVLPGWRDEANRYNKPNDQGFRLVLTGELTASARRMEHLNAMNPDEERARREAERRQAEQEKARAAQEEVEKARRDAAEQARLALEQTRAAEEKARQAQQELERMRQQAVEQERQQQAAAEDARRIAEQRALETQQELERMKQAAAEQERQRKIAAEEARKAEEQQRALEAQLAQERSRRQAEEEQAQRTREQARAAEEAARQARMERDDTDGQFNLALQYYEGRGVPRNYRQAWQHFYNAANMGNVDAKFYLGEMYEEGRGVSVDYWQAAQWYRRAAEQGHPIAQACLGLMYKQGVGVSQDERLAHKWCGDAVEVLGIRAEQGEVRAQAGVGAMYQAGCNLAQNDRLAMQWFHRAAEQGHVVSQNNLAWMLKEGRGGPRDDRLAVKWYRQAAEQGYATAQSNLGKMYMDGRGVPQNDWQAAEWFRKAAEQGYPNAQHNLGAMYAMGRGVPRDRRLAIEWFSKAAAQGFPDAQQALRQMEMQGRSLW